MSLEFIRKSYGVPAEIGRAVVCSGEPGVIVGFNSAHIEVLLDKHKPGTTGYYHPTWEVVYGDMKPIRPMTRSQKRYARFLDADSGLSFAEWLGVGRRAASGEGKAP